MGVLALRTGNWRGCVEDEDDSRGLGSKQSVVHRRRSEHAAANVPQRHVLVWFRGCSLARLVRLVGLHLEMVQLKAEGRYVCLAHEHAHDATRRFTRRSTAEREAGSRHTSGPGLPTSLLTMVLTPAPGPPKTSTFIASVSTPNPGPLFRPEAVFRPEVNLKTKKGSSGLRLSLRLFLGEKMEAVPSESQCNIFCLFFLQKTVGPAGLPQTIEWV